MSYILDALKKSQLERERGQVPRLDQPWFDEPNPSSRPWSWGMIAALLAATALGVAVYIAVRPLPMPAPSSDEAAAVAPAPVIAPVAEPTIPAPVARAPQIFIAPALPEDGRPLPRGAAELHAALTPAPVPDAAPNDSSVRIPEDLRAEVAAFRQQLRQRGAIQGRLFTLSAHVYDADPTQRFVYINGRKFQEQQTISEGVILTRIVPEGIWLDVGGEAVFQPR